VPQPDVGIKKVVIPQQTLSEISASGEYFVRYRVVSDDEVVASEWSPKQKMTAATIHSILGVANQAAISVDSILQPSLDETYMLLSWNTPTQLKDSSFDVFVKWGSGSFEYLDTTNSSKISTLVPTSPSRPTDATFHVQIASSSKQVSTSEYVKLFSKTGKTSSTP
jgi:hypothetical protein